MVGLGALAVEERRTRPVAVRMATPEAVEVGAEGEHVEVLRARFAAVLLADVRGEDEALRVLRDVAAR